MVQSGSTKQQDVSPTFFMQTSAPDDTKIVSGEDMEAVDDWVHQMPRFFTQESCFILFRAVYYGVRCTCVGVCVWEEW